MGEVGLEGGRLKGTPKALDSKAEVCPTRAYTCDRMREIRGAASEKRTEYLSFGAGTEQLREETGG